RSRTWQKLIHDVGRTRARRAAAQGAAAPSGQRRNADRYCPQVPRRRRGADKAEPPRLDQDSRRANTARPGAGASAGRLRSDRRSETSVARGAPPSSARDESHGDVAGESARTIIRGVLTRMRDLALCAGEGSLAPAARCGSSRTIERPARALRLARILA